jgi:FAD synthetase
MDSIAGHVAGLTDKELQEKARKAIRLIQRCIELFGIAHVSFSFNGGKDSTVLLHLLRMATSQSDLSDAGQARSFRSFYFLNSDDFDEVEAFVRDMDKEYRLCCEYIEDKDFKQGLKGLVDSGTKAIILGTRRGDPNAANQDVFCPSSDGWPSFMRVNPIMDWSYADVWGFLRGSRLPYCLLYDQGYTSLGAKHNTNRNKALLQEDGTYAPAYMLPDGRLERMGRVSSTKPPPSAPITPPPVAPPAGPFHHRMSSEMDRIEGQRQASEDGGNFSHTASICIIGDEILSGKVDDANLSFLCSELREIGWVVNRAAVVLDDPDAIASELQRLSSSAEIVFSCGGIGPTLDDVTMDGVARFLGKKLSRHQGLEARMRGFFGDSITPAHLKMADLPDGEVELLDYRLPPSDGQGEGELSKWPIVKARNVYILPGVPFLLRQKWTAIKGFLVGSNRVRPFRSLTFRLSISDETQISSALDQVSAEFSGQSVRLGSYPVSKQEDGCQIVLTLEGKEKQVVEGAATRLKSLLPTNCCLAIEEDLRTLLSRSLTLAPSSQ